MRTAPETRWLLARLLEKKPGDIMTYEEMKEVAGKDIRKHRHYLSTARKFALEDHGMVFSAINGIGIERLDDQGIVIASDGRSKKIRKQAYVGRITAMAAITDNLSSDERVRLNGLRTVFGFMERMGETEHIKQIESAVRESRAPLSLEKTLEAFKTNGS